MTTPTAPMLSRLPAAACEPTQTASNGAPVQMLIAQSALALTSRIRLNQRSLGRGDAGGEALTRAVLRSAIGSTTRGDRAFRYPQGVLVRPLQAQGDRGD